MAYEERDNSGILFVEAEKRSDKHPDYKGRALIDGVEYRVSGWKKQGKRGTFLTLAFDVPRNGGPRRERDDDGF